MTQNDQLTIISEEFQNQLKKADNHGILYSSPQSLILLFLNKKIEKKKKKIGQNFLSLLSKLPQVGSRLYYQRPQSVFEEDEAKEATEKRIKNQKNNNNKNRTIFF